METAITKDYVQKLIEHDAEGRQAIGIDDLLKIYNFANKPTASAVYLRPNMYVRFSNIPSLELILKGCSKKRSLDFIDVLNFVDASKGEVSYLSFIKTEFIQGKSWRSLVRLLSSVIPLLALNILIWKYGTHSSMKDIFTGLLSAISIFVAIFSVFTVGQSYMTNQKLRLFKEGRMAYYFAIDRYMTTTGLLGILFCILGLATTDSTSGQIIYSVAAYNFKDLILILLMNASFLAAYVVLRSIREFYITRPGSYYMADLKEEYFKTSNDD